MHLLFDLDGTLTDSGPGIVNCVNHALGVLGRPRVEDAAIRGMIGSPLVAIFRRLLDDDDPALIDRAVATYRERFGEVGIFENRLYPGMAEALQTLVMRGHTMQIVTAKPAPAAQRVVEHFAIGHHFVALHGPPLDQRGCDKADLVAAALRRIDGQRARTLMIGDRRDDMLAARAHGVRAVGAGWGYGSNDELTESGAVFVAADVTALLEWLDR